MPVVKTTKLSTTPAGPFTLKIKCNSGGQFTAELPPATFKIIGTAEVTGATLDKCEAAFFDAMNRFRDAQTAKRKVILHSIQEHKDVAFTHGITLAVAAGVFEEEHIKGADGHKDRFNYEQVDSTIPRAMSDRGLAPYRGDKAEGAIEWTPEREAFFARIGQAIEQISAELRKLKDPKAAAKIADSGKLFLTGGK